MYRIWLVEANGVRTLVRGDVADIGLARALIKAGNHGAAIRHMPHHYELSTDTVERYGREVPEAPMRARPVTADTGTKA
ncbi:hypothetical protein [Cupriavidus basilensis]|uniref:hypothetical protein n=1 Tax=Cupriavidus basilensis TaxID=68895 RepID=UPI000751953A|nr:hypothetical protein [Cupriavidus basilensis]